MKHDLRRRPAPEKLTVQSLLELVQEGRIRIPPFQRSFRWKIEDAELLIDSVVRGYPIGTFLFWKRQMQSEKVHLGPLTLIVPERSDALLVVDGQQRITSLVNVLLPPHISTEERRDYRLDWNFAEDRVVRASTPVSPGVIRLPLDRAVDGADLSEWVVQSGLIRDDVRKVFELARTIREYEFLGYVVEADDERVLRRVFARANTSGKRLRADEVFNAINGHQSSGEPHDLATLAEALETAEFGAIDSKWLHQATLAVAGIDSTSSGASTVEIAEDSFILTAAALKRTVRFLREDAEIPYSILVPYGLVFPILASFFHKHPEPNDRSRQLLARWVWRGAITGAHRGDEIPERRRNFRALGDDEEASVQSLLRLVGNEPRNLEVHGRLSRRDALARLWMLVLVGMSPLDVATGDPSDVPALLGRPWSKLQNLVPERDERNERSIPLLLANRILSASSANVLWEASDVARDVAESHGLSSEILVLLVENRFDEALALRARDLELKAEEMIGSRARWGDSDRPSIDYMASHGDD